MSEDIVEITEKIPSSKLTQDVLKDLSKVIDEQYQETKKTGSYSSVTYSYKVKRQEREFKTGNRTNFLSEKIVRPDLTKVSMFLYSRNTEIRVDLNLSVIFDSDIKIKRDNRTTLNDINGRIEAIFDDPTIKTRNHLFHSRWSWLISIMILLPLNILNPILVKTSLDFKLSLALTAVALFCVPTKWFFNWLFPQIETEYTIQVKIRNKVLSVIGIIGVSLLVDYIWLYLPH